MSKIQDLAQAFDATKVDPTQGVGQLPVGKHPVKIVDSEIKAAKTEGAGFLQLDLIVLDGPRKGAMGAYRLNLYNSNEKAVEIAYKQLSAVCHVCGVLQVTNSSQLHDIPFIVEVEPQEDER